MPLKKFLSIFIILCLHAVFCKSQSSSDFVSLKNFTPPSPEAAALGRYGEIPTNPSTGVPQISVPLYEIKSGKLSIPISLSYHASGIKVNDISTPVGIGWVLNAGGEVSRCIIGKADESNGGLLNISSALFTARSALVGARFGDGTQLGNMQNFSVGTYDAQSDNYFYSVGDISGKFVYDTAKNIHISPQDRQPKIFWNADSTFTIIDDAGNIYYFTAKEHSRNSRDSEYFITTWHISKIVSADLAESIEFYYQTATAFADTSEAHTYTLAITNDPFINICDNSATLSPSFASVQNVSDHERLLVDSIKFSNGYVKFVYVNDRLDMLPERLSALRIGNNDGVIKKIELKQSYFYSDIPGDTPVNVRLYTRLRLDTVKFNTKNSQPVNNYSFQYNNKKLPAYWTVGDDILKNEADFWGYYNGNGANGFYKTTIPSNCENDIYSFLSNNGYGLGAINPVVAEYRNRSSSKYPNPSLMDGCMLKRINYPTGGYTVFEFETNRLASTGLLSDYRGGLRVSKIISFDTVNRKPMVKSYAYDGAFSISNEYAGDFKYQTTNALSVSWNNEYSWCMKSQFHINANPINAIGYFNGSPIIYQQVTEYDGFPGHNNGKTVYQYECVGDSSYNVTELGKYWNYNTDKSWARGNLLNKKIYKTENDSSILVKEVRNYYSDFVQEGIKVGIVCDRVVTREGSYTTDLGAMMLDSIALGETWRWLLTYYEYFDVVLSSGVKKLIKTEEIEYLDHNITNTKEFFYEGTGHLYPTKTLTYTSISGDTLKEIVKYPQDRAIISNPSFPDALALDSMVGRNILNVPVEIDQYKNNQSLTQNLITFKNWNTSGRFYNEYGYRNNEARVQYKAYDIAGNPTTLSKSYGADIAYIWSYNKAYPVAQVNNANDSMIAYTSFETPDGGNWNFLGVPSTSTSVTGRKSYDLSSGVTSNLLPSGKKYIVTYWSLSTAATVTWYSNSSSGTATAINKKTKNGWTLYEHLLPINTILVVLGGSISIDELRLYPEDAQMTSYTYQPLVGVTSSCSVNDIISYYEYDDFARLKTIRDYDNNILKTIDYSYNSSQGASVSGWKGTDSIRYQYLNAHYTGLVEKQEKDFNSSSPTYNQTRWVPFDLVPFDISEWVITDDYICFVHLGDTTGYVNEKYVDINPYSTMYQKYKWVISYNSIKCPPPCVLPRGKIINGVCEQGFRVDTGSYYEPLTGLWTCVYHYVWSDLSYSDDYLELHQVACPEDE